MLKLSHLTIHKYKIYWFSSRSVPNQFHGGVVALYWRRGNGSLLASSYVPKSLPDYLTIEGEMPLLFLPMPIFPQTLPGLEGKKLGRIFLEDRLDYASLWTANQLQFDSDTTTSYWSLSGGEALKVNCYTDFTSSWILFLDEPSNDLVDPRLAPADAQNRPPSQHCWLPPSWGFLAQTAVWSSI